MKNDEGYDVIEPYRAFITSTHHEYWSKQYRRQCVVLAHRLSQVDAGG
jgi:hypothetical protein